MLFVRPATRKDAGEIARIDVETWRDTYPGVLPTKVLLGLSPARLAADWQAQLAHRPDDTRVAEWTGIGIVGLEIAARRASPSRDWPARSIPSTSPRIFRAAASAAPS